MTHVTDVTDKNIKLLAIRAYARARGGRKTEFTIYNTMQNRSLDQLGIIIARCHSRAYLCQNYIVRCRMQWKKQRTFLGKQRTCLRKLWTFSKKQQTFIGEQGAFTENNRDFPS